MEVALTTLPAQINNPVDRQHAVQLLDEPAMKSRQDEIAGILRNTVTVLQRDELIAEWVEIELNSQGGQIDQSPPGGVQQSDRGISKAARILPVPGKTEKGRRKFIERSIQIAGICAQAKAAAVAAGLDNRRTELLKVAKEKAADAQIAKVREIVENRLLKKVRKAKSAKTDSSTPDEMYSALVNGWRAAPPEIQEKFMLFLRTELQPDGS
jgi:hypothetical protein